MLNDMMIARGETNKYFLCFTICYITFLVIIILLMCFDRPKDDLVLVTEGPREDTGGMSTFCMIVFLAQV
jgi:hypothetical protein